MAGSVGFYEVSAQVLPVLVIVFVVEAKLGRGVPRQSRVASVLRRALGLDLLLMALGEAAALSVIWQQSARWWQAALVLIAYGYTAVFGYAWLRTWEPAE